ncbi:MAG: FG-GAP-like repeat-containing protein, partial [Bacteroidia bacterium]
MKKILLFGLTHLFLLNFSEAQPTITYFSPLSGPVGSLDTIYGSGFSSTPANNIVFFGATRANVLNAIATRLVLTVPVGATCQPITVTVSGLTAYSGNNFIVTYGNGSTSISTNSFLNGGAVATGNNPSSVAISDIDGDGKPDMVVSNSVDSTISILRNTGSVGNINYSTKVDILLRSSPDDFRIADMNGDGKPDIIVGNNYPRMWYTNPYALDTISFFRNTSSPGAISFASRQILTTGNTYTNYNIVDINKDGKPDIIKLTVNYGLFIYLNSSSSTYVSFAPPDTFLGGSYNSDFAYNDLDGDGKPDIVIRYTYDSVLVFNNTTTAGALSFSSRLSFRSGVYLGNLLSINDMDGDGKPDLIFTSSSNNPDTIAILRNVSTGGTISFAASTLILNNTCGSLFIYDLDGDGKQDIISNYSDCGSFLKNTSTIGSFGFSTNTFRKLGLGKIKTIGDVDLNGKPDLIVAPSSNYYNPPYYYGTIGKTFIIYRDTIFIPPSISGFSPSSGKAGALVTIYGTNLDTIFSNNKVFFGTIPATIIAGNTTQLIISVPPGFSSQYISVLSRGLTAYSGKPFLVTFPCGGNINSNSFAPKTEFYTRIQPFIVSLADIDGDGKADIITSNNTDTFTVLRNTSIGSAISFAPKIDVKTYGSPC